MTTIETVKGYINRLCTEAGADPQEIYNHENETWYFSKGSSTLEVFLTSYETAEKVIRTFIRCLSAIYPIPVDPSKRQELYFVALEVNTRNMGVKIGTMADNGYMYAIAEREIDGMDYREFVVLVNDVGYWAEQLSDLFKSRFGEPQSNLN
jgi:hypothetical protein